MRMADLRSAARTARGFTLFEVMAAVLILGVFYTVLANTAIQGLRSEGESLRRMEASLLVDEHLSEVETGIAGGIFPEIGVLESEDRGYFVRLEVTPFDVTPYLTDPADPESALEDDSLLVTDRPEESLLRQVTVSVAWDEPEGEREVTRTTLAYDQSTLSGLFPETGAGGQAEDDTLDEERFLNPDGTPNLDAMREHLESLAGDLGETE